MITDGSTSKSLFQTREYRCKLFIVSFFFFWSSTSNTNRVILVPLSNQTVYITENTFITRPKKFLSKNFIILICLFTYIYAWLFGKVNRYNQWHTREESSTFSIRGIIVLLVETSSQSITKGDIRVTFWKIHVIDSVTRKSCSLVKYHLTYTTRLLRTVPWSP